mgnify:CR=1 FL=1|jgi:integrase
MEGRGAMSKDLPVKASFSSAGNALPPVPAHLQGVPGTQRAVSSANALGVDSDHEAIVVWLNTRAKNAHTRKAYLQELRRFMAFMLYLRGRPVSSATLGDLEAFRVWLAVPYLPAEGWPADFMPFKLDCAAGDGQTPRLRGLSIGSRRRADTTIRSFFRFLHEGGYLAANPCMKLGRLTGEEISHDELEKLQLSPERYARQRRQEAIALDNQDQGKAFSIALWRWLRGFLDSDENTWQIPDSPGLANDPTEPGQARCWPQERRERLRCILLFGYAAASRRAELAETMMNAIVRSGQRWVWKVIGKGRTATDGPDRVTLDDQALDALIRYRLARGLPGHPSPDEGQTPLIAKLTPKRVRPNHALKTGQGVTAGYLNTELQRFFSYAAPFAARQNPDWAPILRQAASHWLRHTRGSHFALGQVSLAMTAEHLRHKDPRTTSKYYVHLDDEARGGAIDSISRLLDEN